MRFLLLFSFLFCINTSINANILVDNGNYNPAFYDVKEENSFKLIRAYNSVSTVSGMFGYGWGSPYEAKVSSIGGIVIVEEIPGGGRSVYLPKEKIDLSKLIDTIVEAATRDTNNRNKDYLSKLKTLLIENDGLILEFSKKYNIKSTAPVGSVFVSKQKSNEYVKKISTGYLRQSNTGEKAEFDRDGKQIKLTYPNGDNLKFYYGSNGRLNNIKDSKGRNLTFIFNSQGLVSRVSLYNGSYCDYKYDEAGNLIESRDVGNHIYSYKYDAYHNMIELVLPAEQDSQVRAKTIVKYDVDKDKVVYTKTPEGEEAFYEYRKNEDKNDYYSSTSVTKKFNNAVDAERYEIWKRPRPDGSLYVYKMRETRNKDVKTGVYTQCCGTPLMLDDNGKVTKFEYDEKGRLRRKIFPDRRVLDIKYNNKGLIEKILNNGQPYMFKYDETNRIIFAGMRTVRFKLTYDKKGMLYSIKDNLGRAFTLDYDKAGNVVKVSSKLGSISIDSMNSSEGIDDKVWEIRKAYMDYIEVMAVMALLSTD